MHLLLVPNNAHSCCSTIIAYLLYLCRYFHITSGLPPDVMHDVLEGAIHVEVKCLLKELVQNQKLFTLQTVNERILSFPYGDDISDKPRKFPNTFFTSGSFRNGGITL